MLLDPASAAAAAALATDPFYECISSAYESEPERRRDVLTRYFAYSITEGRDHGRCVHLRDTSCGVAVWLLPQAPAIRAARAERKHIFLAETLGRRGSENYDRIVAYMGDRASSVVRDDAWYLSIVAVDPAAQGRGLGRHLLAPTLAEADAAAITCYLETFSPRSIPFYERLGFKVHAVFVEPTTTASYSLMVRGPRAGG